MSKPTLAKSVTTILDKSGIQEGGLTHEKSGVHVLRYETTRSQDMTVYHPLLCLVLQGEKEVKTGARTFKVKAGDSLIVSHTIPVVSSITKASNKRPYMALVFTLDLDILRSLGGSLGGARGSSSPSSFSITVSATDLDMQDALSRLLYQSQNEDTQQILVPITRQEIHARLLLGSHSETLRKMLWHENTANRIHQATQNIREHLSQDLIISELAERVGMSKSAFFEQFKSITGTSPLQYQKELRLLQARDWLRSSGDKVSDVAFRIGYESSAQFSREYSRKFGVSPKSDRQFS